MLRSGSVVGNTELSMVGNNELSIKELYGNFGGSIPTEPPSGESARFTCPVTALIRRVEYLRCAIRPRQAHFRMFSSRKANTSGSQIFTPRWRKSCPSSTVWPMGG